MVAVQYLFAGIFAFIVLISHFKLKREEPLLIGKFFKLISYALALIFFFYFMLGHDALQDIVKLEGGAFGSKFLTFVSLVLHWMMYSVVLILILYPFFKKSCNQTFPSKAEPERRSEAPQH